MAELAVMRPTVEVEEPTNTATWVVLGAATALGLGALAYFLVVEDDKLAKVPPAPAGLTAYESEAFDYGDDLVIVLDRPYPKRRPKKWRWRVYDADKYGDGRDIEGLQRAGYRGLSSRALAYERAVRFIENTISGAE